LTDNLLKAGAKFVAIDILFRDSLPGDAECGAIFAKHADQLAITSMLSSNEGTLGGARSLDEPNDDIIPLQGPEIVGVANFPSDVDGIVRRLTHGFYLDLLLHPEWAQQPGLLAKLKLDLFTFSWLAAEKTLGHPPNRSPTEPMLVNFFDRENSIQIIPIEDLILNWDTAYQHGAVFKGRTVFFGAISEVRFKDEKITSVGALPGVVCQATAYSNLVHGDWLNPAPGWIAPALVAVFGLLSLLICLGIDSVLARVGLLLGLIVIFILATQWLFNAHLLVVPVSGALLGLVGCGGFGTIYDFVLERYERRRVLGVFETMVSPGVANLVLSNRDDFEQRLGGQRKDVIILFSDIRGFTTWSEKVGPDALVAQLNEYFYGMVEVIQQEGGTVQKYIGDALMAAWGDVYDRPLKDCAIEAVRSALRMGESLKKLNADWVGKEKREQLAIGVGINLGEGVVGRIGHPRRQEFTVMGDAVNLAARLESATKQYHQTVLVGQQIYELTREVFDFRLADKMQVKGKTFAVPVYTPLGYKAAPPPPGLAEYNAAIEKYYGRDFAAASPLFKSANEKMGGGDFLCENFIERSEAFMYEPPPANWDGGWTLKEK
jgi:adenylate cyclase